MTDVRNYKCFKQVADVIGEERAVEELGKVDRIIYDDATLDAAFMWDESPQGPSFWGVIDDGKNPYTEKTQTTKSDGSTASYYELPEGVSELQHLISHRNMNAQIGEIFRACYRYGLVEHSEMLRDAKKIKFYAEAEIERLGKLEETDK